MIEVFYNSIRWDLRKKPPRNSWINVIQPTEEEVKVLKEMFNLPDFMFSSLRDIDEQSRTERYKKFRFIIVRTPQRRSDGEKVEYFTVPLGIVISDEYLITICFSENDVIEKLRRSKFSTAKKIRTTLRILYISARLYLEYLKEINRETHAIQEELRRSMRNEELFKLLRLEEALVYFNTSLRSNQLLIEKLTKSKVFTKYPQDKELLEDVIVENQQALEMTNIYSDILGGMMDAFASIISNNLNIVMKFLTSVTIILMIPTLISSFYGMNVALPFQRSPNAFLIILGLSMLFSVLGMIVFWKREFF